MHPSFSHSGEGSKGRCPQKHALWGEGSMENREEFSCGDKPLRRTLAVHRGENLGGPGPNTGKYFWGLHSTRG